MSGIDVRPARADEIPAVARLRWRWLLENKTEPAGTQESFVRSFESWARASAGTHRCMVLVCGNEVIGMAWLALIQRVPTPRSVERLSGDVQCVYVLPEQRDSGLGGKLIDAVLTLARDLGLERVTVHSSERAISAYARRGFKTSPRLLQVNVAYPY